MMLAIAGCRDLEDPTAAAAPRLVVHAVLDASSSTQQVLVARARTGATTTTASSLTDDEPVFGATVELIAPDGQREVRFEQSPANPGVYAFIPNLTSPFNLALGSTYTLHVHTPDGEDVSGMTTIPSPPPSPAFSVQPFSRSRDTLRLTWHPVPGARSYELVIRSRRTERYRTFTDTSLVLPGTALTVNGDTIFTPGRLLDVVVTAVDVNYYEYYRAQSDPFAGASPSRLSGAEGVFGSVVTIHAMQVQVR